jgi:hypothetical protein
MEFTFLVRGTGTLPRLISKATSEFKISGATFFALKNLEYSSLNSTPPLYYNKGVGSNLA